MPICAYHPDRTAAERCAECGRDICGECTDNVAGKAVCIHCVANIRSRVAAEMANAAPAVQSSQAYGSEPPPSGFATPDPYTGGASAAGAAYQMPNPVVQEAPNPARLLLGIVLGALFGAIGAFLWKTVAYYAKFELAYLNILVGCAAGFGVVTGSGRQGIVPAILGAILGFCSMMFGYYLLLNAQFSEALPGLPAVPFNLFVEFMKELDVIDWLFVAAGVYGGFTIPMNKEKAETNTE